VIFLVGFQWSGGRGASGIYLTISSGSERSGFLCAGAMILRLPVPEPGNHHLPLLAWKDQ
jgi:hypothetical protein